MPEIDPGCHCCSHERTFAGSSNVREAPLSIESSVSPAVTHGTPSQPRFSKLFRVGRASEHYAIRPRIAA
jgi:hypothetical protein